MSKVKIQGNASGTGVLTVTAPNTDTDRTITLPDADVTLGTDATKLPLAGGTMTGDLILGDDVSLEIGSATNGDLQLYHSGGNNTIDSKTGDLVIRTDALRMYNQANNEALIKGDADGEVQLFHNGVEKFNTTSAGVQVTGTVTQSGNKTALYSGQYDGTTTGTTTLSNITFKPMAIWCLFFVNESSVASWGFAGRHGTQSVLFDNSINNSSTHWWSSNSYIGELKFGGGNDAHLAVTTWNDDNIVLTRSKSGSGNSSAVAYRILVMG